MDRWQVSAKRAWIEIKNIHADWNLQLRYIVQHAKTVTALTFWGARHWATAEMRASEPSRRTFQPYVGKPRTKERIRFGAHIFPAICESTFSAPSRRANVFLLSQSSPRIEECSDGYTPLPKKMMKSNMLSEDERVLSVHSLRVPDWVVIYLKLRAKIPDGMAIYHQPC